MEEEKVNGEDEESHDSDIHAKDVEIVLMQAPMPLEEAVKALGGKRE